MARVYQPSIKHCAKEYVNSMFTVVAQSVWWSELRCLSEPFYNVLCPHKLAPNALGEARVNPRVRVHWAV